MQADEGTRNAAMDPGGELFISHRTVETHRRYICEKLELSSNHALLAFAFAHKSES